jgi:hypothetical protein
MGVPRASLYRCRNHFVVDTHRPHRNPRISHTHGAKQVDTHRLARFGAQAIDRGVSIIAGRRGQIDTRDGAQQPRQLSLLFDTATSGCGWHNGARRHYD